MIVHILDAETWLLLEPPDKIKNSTFCLHIAFMCFVWISDETAIIFLYSIKWLVFITETGCVCCALAACVFFPALSSLLSSL